MDNNKIKNFYEAISNDKDTLQKIQNRLQEAQNYYDLEEIVDKIVLPKVNEMGLNISKEELLNYEKDSIKSLNIEDLMNVSGGMSLKGAVLGGGVFFMALLGLEATNSPQANAVNFEDIKNSVQYLPKAKTEPATNAANGNTLQQAPSEQDNNNNNTDETDEDLEEDNTNADNDDDDSSQESLSLEGTKKSADFLPDSETAALSTKQQAESELAAQEQTDSAYIIENLNLFVPWLYNYYGMTENFRLCNGGTQTIAVGEPNANDGIPEFEFNKSSGEGSPSAMTSLFPSPTGEITIEGNYKGTFPFKLLCDNDPEKSPKFLAQTCAFIHNHIRKTDDKAVKELEDYIKIVNSVIETKNKLKGYYSVEIEKLNGIWKEYEPLKRNDGRFKQNIIEMQRKLYYLNKNNKNGENNKEIQDLNQKISKEEEDLKGNKEYNENLENLQKKKEEINNKFGAIANEIIQIDVNFYKKENARVFQEKDINPPNLIKFYNKLEYKYRKNTPALIFETIPKQEQPLFLESVTNFIEENFDGFLTDEDLTADKKVNLNDEGTFYKVHALMNLLHNFNVMIMREEAANSQEEVTAETTKFIPKYTTERMFMCYVVQRLRNNEDCKKFYEEVNNRVTVPVAKNKAEREREAARLKAAEYRINKFKNLFDYFALVKGTPYKQKARENKNINIVTRNEDETFVINKDTFADCADVTAFHVMTLLGYNNGWDYLLQDASGQEETLKKLDADLAKIKGSVETHEIFRLTDNSLKYRLQLLGRYMSNPSSDCNGIFEGILWNLIISNMNSSASETHYKDIRYVGTVDKTHPENEIDTGFLNHLKVMYNLAEALTGQTDTEELITAQKNIDNLSQQINGGKISKEVLETTVQGIYSLFLPQGNVIEVTREEDIDTTNKDYYGQIKIVVKDSQKEKFSFDTRQENNHAKVVFNPIIISKFKSGTRKFVKTDSIAQIIDYNGKSIRKRKVGNTLEEIFNYIYLNDEKLEKWAKNMIKNNQKLKQYYANIKHLKFFKNMQGVGNDWEEIEELTINKIFPGTNVDVYKDGKKLADLDLFIFDNYISKSSEATETYFNFKNRTNQNLFGKKSEYFEFLKQHERVVNLGGVNFGVKFVKGSQDQVEIFPFLGPNEESLAITELTIPEQIKFNGKEVIISGVLGKNSFSTALPNLKKITIKTDNIGEDVFSNCSKLQTVEIKSKTLCIEKQAFYNCPAQKNINFSINLENLEIGEKAFYNSGIQALNWAVYTNLTKLNIGGCAFERCKLLEIINFPPSIEKLEIEEEAFYKSAIKALDLSGCVNLDELNIGWEAFHDCSALETVNFEGSVINIGNKAFPAQQWLMNVIINANFIGLIVMAIATIVSGVTSSSFLQALYFGAPIF